MPDDLQLVTGRDLQDRAHHIVVADLKLAGLQSDGTVTGDPIAGVTISFGSAASDTTTSSAGTWSATNLAGEVTVTPSHSDYEFSPASKTVTEASSSVDFTGYASFRLAGTVLDEDGMPLQGTTITMTFDDQERETTTDVVGTWKQNGLYGSVVVTATLPGYEFSPADQNYTQEATSADFVGEVQACSAGDPADAANPCTITNLAQLQLMQANLSGHYALGANINATPTASWNSSAGFEPIGDDNDPFVGTFDGDGHRIHGLTIDRSASKFVGLFGKLGESAAGRSEVRNLELTNMHVTGDTYTGGLAGENTGNITKVAVSGVVSGGGNTGGLVGYHATGGTIEHAQSAGTVTGGGSVGGLVGNTNSANVSYSHSTANVSGSGLDVGGLVGHNSYNVVTHSWSSGDVENTSSYTGGLLGKNNDSEVHYSYSTSNVTGTDFVGGFVGRASNSNSLITNSYALGNVTGTNEVGGFVGETIKPIEQSFSAGEVSGSTNIGGFAGKVGNNSDVTESYWDTHTSQQTQSAGDAEGKTTTEMYQQASFAGWDFTDVWFIAEGSNYPSLQENPR